MAKRNAVAKADSEMVISPEVLAAFQEAAASIPAASGSEGDVWGSITAQILNATSIEDLDSAWRTEGLRDLVNVPIRVEGLTRRESDYDKGLDQYLIIRATNLDTGEKVTVTTGSISCMLQLVQAFRLGALPLDVIPRESEKPTESGYRPLHLEIVRKR